MGSGAKIALVALLILMVVAVAKFVQNGKEDDGGTPPVLTNVKKDAAGKDAKSANNPRLATPKSVAGSTVTTTPATPGRQFVPPTGGGAASPVVRSPGTGSPAPGSIPSPISSPAVPGAQPRPPAETVKSSPATQGSPGSAIPGGSGPGGSSPAGASPGGGTPGPLVSSAGSAPVPIPGFSPTDNKVGATITPPKSESPAEKREEVKSATGPLVVSQNPARRPETEEPPAPKKTPEPSPPGVINLVEPAVKKDVPPASGTVRAFPVSHVVESGESYWRIAEKYYGAGNGRFHTTISGANGGGKLIAGKTIQIPAPPAAATDSTTSSNGKAETARKEPVKPPRPADGIVASDSKYDYYLVQKGDTLTGIAQRRLGGAGKVSVLEAANPTLRYETLREGARLRIPKK